MDHQTKAVSAILEEWELMKPKIEELFRNRDQKNAKIQMQKGILLFKQFLAIANDSTIVSGEQIISYQQLICKPVNLEERLEFIVARPNLHHSYIQLAELMVELQKLFVKKNIIKKSSS